VERYYDKYNEDLTSLFVITPLEYTGNAAYKAKDVTVGAVGSAVGATKGAYQKVASKVS
jgi:hypothetical protein